MLTEDDDLIRQHDTPERMQLANSSLSQSSTLAFQDTLTENDLDDAASWVITRLSPETERAFFRPDGQFHPYLRDLVQAVSYALRFLFIQEFEVPYIWTHKKDYITYFNPENLRTKIELLSLEDLWRVYSLGLKYRSLVDRRKALDSLYARLGASDHYYENEIRKRVESVEMVADATEWVSMKYRDDKKHKFDMAFHDDEEQETKHWKAPSRVSAYEIAKKSVVSKLAEVGSEKRSSFCYSRTVYRVSAYSPTRWCRTSCHEVQPTSFVSRNSARKRSQKNMPTPTQRKLNRQRSLCDEHG